jgi:O-antigen ligase
MSRPSDTPKESISPAEWAVGSLAFLTVATTTWGFAGRAGWAPPVFTALACLTALTAVVLSYRAGRRFHRVAFAPLLIFGLLVAISLMNPSHEPVAGIEGNWVERANHLRWLPSTVDRATTRSEMLPWLSALLLGAALRQAALGRRATRLFLAVLLGHGVLLALVGVYYFFTDRGHILGHVWSRQGYHFASFVYRNHWAAYVLLLMTLALGFVFSALRRWAVGRGRLDASLAGLGLALLLGLTLPMPGSRSGVVLASLMLCVAMARFAWIAHRNQQAVGASTRLLRLGGVLLFIMLILGGGVLVNRDTYRPHWERTKAQVKDMLAGGEDLRVNLSRDTLAMIADRPVWGWGIGSYGLVFPVYQGHYLQDQKGRTTARVLHAHNDWAEVAAETGLVGLLVLCAPVARLLLAAFRSDGALARWSAGGTGLILLYAVADFPFHCPAVLFLWTAMICTSSPPEKARDAPTPC